MSLKLTYLKSEYLATSSVEYLAVYFEIKIRINQRLYRSMKLKWVKQNLTLFVARVSCNVSSAREARGRACIFEERRASETGGRVF